MSIYFPTSSQCYWNVNYISKFVQPAVAKTAQNNQLILVSLSFVEKEAAFRNSVETGVR